MEEVSSIIQRKMKYLIVDGIKYEKLGDDEFYAQELFEDEELFGYLSKNMIESDKSVYEYVVYDSDVEAEFAKRFEVAYKDGYKLVTVNKPWRASKARFSYALVERGAPAPELPDSIHVVKIPVKKLVCTSTTHLSSLEYLGDIDKLVGFPDTKYISSEKIRVALDEGSITELGSEAGLNIEALLSLEPDLVIDFAMGNEYDNYKVIKKMGIPVVVNADYMENTPLGRAEWIKFISLFLNREKKADSIFGVIRSNYDSLALLARKADGQPTVYSGIVYGDFWYVPGGNNFGAKFLADARGKYLWADDPTSGNIPLSFEAVYDRAYKADYWMGVGSFNSLGEIKKTDIRYTQFDAFKNGNVYNYNAKMSPEGGNAFMELGYLRPDIVLADIIKILHPELLPGYQLFFYQKLEN